MEKENYLTSIPDIVFFLDLSSDFIFILHLLGGGDGLPLKRLETVNKAKDGETFTIIFCRHKLDTLKSYPAFSWFTDTLALWILLSIKVDWRD